jgi:glycosyltransferase involved in cell wall biosynthesis
LKPELVSVMMPAYNAEAFVGQAIESVLAQSNPNWELVIVDDGSSDRTAEVASGYADPRIRLVRQENGGEASARNTALKHMQGEFLAFLDADDLYLPNHLAVTVEYLSSHPKTDGVYTDGYYIDQTGRQLQTLSSRRRGPFEGNLFEEVVYGADVFGPPACVVLRTNLIASHGLRFDENIVIGPDWDFFMKYADVGNFGYLDQITCLYRLHTTNISVRTGLKKRALELAKCRVNAIKTRNFGNCSVRVRAGVFYDLLINLLIDFPEWQTEITHWQEFMDLPKQEQVRLLRLMASMTIVHGQDQSQVGKWLERARQVHPSDWRAGVLWLLFRIHPKLLSAALKIKEYREVDPRTIPPFADMNLGGNR